MKNCIQMEKEYIPDKRRENITGPIPLQAEECTNATHSHEEELNRTFTFRRTFF